MIHEHKHQQGEKRTLNCIGGRRFVCILYQERDTLKSNGDSTCSWEQSSIQSNPVHWLKHGRSNHNASGTRYPPPPQEPLWQDMKLLGAELYSTKQSRALAQLIVGWGGKAALIASRWCTITSILDQERDTSKRNDRVAWSALYKAIQSNLCIDSNIGGKEGSHCVMAGGGIMVQSWLELDMVDCKSSFCSIYDL